MGEGGGGRSVGCLNHLHIWCSCCYCWQVLFQLPTSLDVGTNELKYTITLRSHGPRKYDNLTIFIGVHLPPLALSRWMLLMMYLSDTSLHMHRSQPPRHPVRSTPGAHPLPRTPRRPTGYITARSAEANNSITISITERTDTLIINYPNIPSFTWQCHPVLVTLKPIRETLICNSAPRGVQILCQPQCTISIRTADDL